MSSIKLIKHLTPNQAWEMFYPCEVELFISFFHYDAKPVYDLEEMCLIYAKDTLNEMRRPYTLEQKEHLANLFLEYINAYISKMGGYDKLVLYSEEEVEAIEEKEYQALMEEINKHFKKPRRY